MLIDAVTHLRHDSLLSSAWATRELSRSGELLATRELSRRATRELAATCHLTTARVLPPHYPPHLLAQGMTAILSCERLSAAVTACRLTHTCSPVPGVVCCRSPRIRGGAPDSCRYVYLLSSQADQPTGRRSTHLGLSPPGCRPLLSGPPLV
jgi:hypothetical protein